MSEPKPEIMPTAEPLMAGKRGLIMGVANERSLAWGIARSVAENGGQLAFTYQGDALARRVGPLAESLGSNIVLPCDVNDDDALDAVFDDISPCARRSRRGPFSPEAKQRLKGTDEDPITGKNQ